MHKIIKISLITVIVAAIIIALILCARFSDEKAYSATVYSYTSSTFDINSQQDFESFVNTFGNDTYSFMYKTIYLNCNVDMTGISSFLPYFSGTFYGNGYAINNASTAIFGSDIGTNGSVFDLVIQNINSTFSNSAVAGINYGKIQNVKVTGNMNYYSLGGLVYTNYGTISDCYNYANLNISNIIDSAGLGGIVFNNYKIVTDSHFFGNITANNTVKSLGGIVAYNKSYVSGENNYYGLVERCSATAQINIVTTGNVELDSTLPTNCGTLIGNNNGQLINSYFIGNYAGYLSLPITIVGDDSANTNPAPYINVYMMTQAINLAYDNFTSDFVTVVNEISDYIDYNSPNDTVFASVNNSYPLLKIFRGEGTAVNPFLVEDVFDLYNLRGLYNTDGIGYSVVLSDDIDCRNYNIFIDLDGFTYNSIVDGRGFALHNYEGSALFVDDQSSILFNTGFYNSPNIAILGELFDETSNYNYGYGGLHTDIVKAIPVEGDGTELDPYEIRTASELAYLDGSDAYFQLENSIVVNSVSGNTAAFYLNIATFSGNLNGNSYSIVGLFESLVGINTGVIENLDLKGYIVSGTNSLVAATNNGTITDVTVYSSIGEAVIGYANVTQENNGTISKVQCYGNDATAVTAVAGIAIVNNNLIENCFVDMTTTDIIASVNVEGTINTSIGWDTLYKAIDNNLSVDMNYFDLVESGFDVNSIFGYELNTSLSYPTLRVDGLSYKTSSDFLYDKTRTFVYTFSETSIYNKSQFHNLIVDSIYGMTINWTYNEQDYNTPTILQDAGLYAVNFVYGGDNLYLPSTYTHTVTINKQTQTAALEFEGAFDNITDTYNGIDIVVTEPDPTNLLTYGYTYTYTISDGENVITAIRNAGEYTQTITGVCLNYTNVTAHRTITVNKADITMEIGNLSINYLESATLSNATITLNGLTFNDIPLPLNQLLKADTTIDYSTDYVTGSNVGEYYIACDITLTNYNITSVIQGTLTVNKIDLTQGTITFISKTVAYTGNEVLLYAENIPDGVNVSYDDNSYTNNGIYDVVATFSRANYNDLVLNASLTIEKIDLTFTANNLTLDYLAERTGIEQNQFSYTADGFVGADIDNITTVISGLTFIYAVTIDSVEITVFDADIYDIELDITGILTNYNIVVNNGILTISPASMTALYASHDNYNATYNGEMKTHPITFFDIYEGITVSYAYYKGEVLVDSAINASVYNVVAQVPKISENYLDTTYNYTITIARANINIFFDSASYSAEYSSENKATSNIYPYLGTLPQGLETGFFIKQAGITVDEAKAAGVYTLGYEVVISENYNAKVITASLTVTPKAVAITMQGSYTYSGNNIVPILTGITGGLNQEVDGNDFTFLYYNSSMQLLTRIIRAGSYTVRASVNDSNYILEVTDYNIYVNKLSVSIDLKYLEYSYGFVGPINYGGIDYTIYSGGVIERNNYAIPSTTAVVDIRYTIARDDAGTYTVTSLTSGENYVYTISGDSSLYDNNKVKITPVTLSSIWKYGNTEISGIFKTLEYSGVEEFQNFSYIIIGFVKNHTQSSFTFTMNERNAKTLYDVGNYELFVTLLNESNYVMDGSFLTVTIQKATLNVKMIDVTVLHGENFQSRSYQILNAVGNDSSISNIYTIKGANLSVFCNYTTSSSVGSIFDYYFEGSFTNYNLYISQVGKLTVLFNPKIEFTFNDATYSYDGTYKSLRVAQSEEVVNSADAVLEYTSNNYQKNVGTYTVTLTVTYNIDNSKKYYTRDLTILPSYPRLDLEEIQMVYRDNLTLEAEDIKGQAFLGENEIAGTFRFFDSYKLEKGRKAEGYQVVFIPADSENMLAKNGTVYIEGIVLDVTIFQYSNLALISYTENGIEITGPVQITLNSDIIEGLSLYKDNVLVTYIELNKSETIAVSIKYDDEEVYKRDFDVVFLENSENVEIVVDSSYLELISGLTLSKDALIVSTLGGKIALSSEYADKYTLYINGNKIETDYPINGNEGSIVVVIKDNKTSAVLFAEEYTVRVNQVIIEEDPIGNNTVWIVVGSVLGGIGVIIGLYFLIKTQINNKKIGFNPYNKK